MAKLDTELEFLLIKQDFFEKNPSAGSLNVGPDDPLHVSLIFHGDLAALEKAGLRVGSAGKNVAYGVTNLAGLKALANHPQVDSIHLQRDRHTYLNNSVPDIKANQVWGRSGDNFSGYTGRGVIVGIIDTGIDFTHQNFRKADKTTRIVAIWDQTLTAQGGETTPGPITVAPASSPTPLGYGVEYDTSQINDALQGSPAIPVRHIDADGHGTHVVGIAAGDGSQAGGCLISYQYVGVAPEADIIVVRLFGLTKSDKKLTAPASDQLSDAIRYILNKASILNQAAVINLSLGKFTDKMDGSSPFCQDVDTLLTSNSTGRAIVISSGNDGDSNFHASASVAAGLANSLALNFTIYPNDTRGSRSLVVLYSGSNLQVQLTSPVAGAGGVIPWVSSGAAAVVNNTANGSGGTVSVNNVANRISIQITSAAVTPATTPATYQPNIAGTWKLELRNSGASPTPIDAYCLYGSSHDAASPKFLSNTTSRSTLNEDATGKETVAVGSYKVGGELSSFSSRGPTLDSPARTKPDLCAPGDDITSAHSSNVVDEPCTICCCACCEAYVDMSGTSMSAPHITGVIALMLHKDPNLTHTEITAALIANTAPKPADSSGDDNLGWGAGKVDAQATVGSAAVVAVNPPVAARIAAAVATPHPDALIAVRDQLLATERGAEFEGLLETHFAEVRTLIRTNRRVATVWHRCKGPIWVRLSLQAAYTPDLPIPLEAGGVCLREAIRRFAHVLLRYASASFRDDLLLYESEVAAIAEGMSLTDVIRLLGNGHSESARVDQALAL